MQTIRHAAASTNHRRGRDPLRRVGTPLALILIVSLTSACSTPPTPKLLNEAREPITELDAELGSTFTLVAEPEGSPSFPTRYEWVWDPRYLSLQSSKRVDKYIVAEFQAKAVSETTVLFQDPRNWTSVTDSVVVTVTEPSTEPEEELEEEPESEPPANQPPEPDEVPTLSLETKLFDWSSTPNSDLGAFSQVSLSATFTITADSSFTFEGDGTSGASHAPADELQISARAPSQMYAETLDATFVTFPEGTYKQGDSLTWAVSIDLSKWPTGAQSFTIRPTASDGNTLSPTLLTLSNQNLVVLP